MQHPFSCTPSTYAPIEVALSPARLARYLHSANGDKHLALRLYVWNARLCEAIYFPLQTAEVVVRNAIHIPVEKRFGPQWFKNHKFENILPHRMKNELSESVRKESKKRGLAVNQNHIVANLSFGFWANLMTKAYDNHLWKNGIKSSFPYAPTKVGREEIYVKLDDLRSFRNDVMHHVAIFDRNPNTHFNNALNIIGLICIETHWLTKQLSRVSQVINDRPKI